MIAPSYIIYYPIGFAYLWIRYRNRAKVLQAKRERYENSYAVAGAILIFSGFGVFLFILLSLFLIAAIYSIFSRPPSKPY